MCVRGHRKVPAQDNLADDLSEHRLAGATDIGVDQKTRRGSVECETGQRSKECCEPGGEVLRGLKTEIADNVFEPAEGGFGIVKCWVGGDRRERKARWRIVNNTRLSVITLLLKNGA